MKSDYLATLRNPPLQLLFVSACGLLLISYGGAIVASPVTVPLLLLIVRLSPSTFMKLAAAIITSLTVAEAVWAVIYVAYGEPKPWVWLLPLLSAAGTAVTASHLGRSKVSNP